MSVERGNRPVLAVPDMIAAPSDLGAQARKEQDERWLANAPKREARAAKLDRIMFWLCFGIPGICLLAYAVSSLTAAMGLVPLLLLVLIIQNAGKG